MEGMKQTRGIIYFKEEENSIKMVRLISDSLEADKKVIVLDMGDNQRKYMQSNDLKDWKPLEPDGFFTANIVTVMTEDGKEAKDVVVTVNKVLEMKYVGDLKPYAVCRQSITDIFYNLLCKEEDEMIVGVAVNRDDCPANFDYMTMLACNGLEQNDCVNFYRTDTVSDILSMIDTTPYDAALRKLYLTHIKYEKKFMYENAKYHKGWCRDLDTLLTSNNFQSDINEMLGISDVMFNIEDYIERKQLPGSDEMYDSVADELRYWLSMQYKINIKDITVLEYFFDIDLSQFNNSYYFFLRDNTKKLYFFSYTIEGEYREADLEAKANEMDFSTKFKLAYYNKYIAEVEKSE